jgi:hypothetical protein
MPRNVKSSESKKFIIEELENEGFRINKWEDKYNGKRLDIYS